MKSRQVTNQVLEALEEGRLDKDQLIRDLLMWMSESDVADFAEHTCLLDDEDEDADFGPEHWPDGQPDEAQEWADFDPDC